MTQKYSFIVKFDYENPPPSFQIANIKSELLSSGETVLIIGYHLLKESYFIQNLRESGIVAVDWIKNPSQTIDVVFSDIFSYSGYTLLPVDGDYSSSDVLIRRVALRNVEILNRNNE